MREYLVWTFNNLYGWKKEMKYEYLSPKHYQGLDKSVKWGKSLDFFTILLSIDNQIVEKLNRHV